MDKEKLLKRQKELQEEFDKTAIQIKEAEAYLNKLSGAYNEIDKMLKDMETPEEKQNEN